MGQRAEEGAGGPLVGICVATNRPTELAAFLRAWEPHWLPADAAVPPPIVFVHEDSPTPAAVPASRLDVRRTCQQDIEAQLGRRAWIIPRGTAASRSFAFLAAWRAGCDFIVSMDDDCLPTSAGPAFLATHLKAFARDRWFRTIDGTETRGVPYGDRGRLSVLLNHGVWEGHPDVDAPTAARHLREPAHVVLRAASEIVPPGMYFPLCAMNVCYARAAMPAAYNLLMGLPAWGLDRFDDIWSGLFLKRIADHLGMYVSSGVPFVHHARASDPFLNLRKEALGIQVHEAFWKHVARAPLDGASSVAGCYVQLADWVERFPAAAPVASALPG